ncbi:MAG: hypothetical protein ACRCZC_06455, partial [Culicoidibacterales bacterium]
MKNSEQLFLAKLSGKIGSLLLLGQALFALVTGGMTVIIQQMWGYGWPMPMMGYQAELPFEQNNGMMGSNTMMSNTPEWMSSDPSYFYFDFFQQMMSLLFVTVGIGLAIWLFMQVQKLPKKCNRTQQWSFLGAAIILLILNQVIIAVFLLITGVIIAWQRQKKHEENE